MLPVLHILGIELHMYSITIIIGVLLAIVIFTALCYRDKIKKRIFNFYLIACIASTLIGFIFAVLFQAAYVWIETGTFDMLAGMTFNGGLIGGCTAFLIIFLIWKTPERTAELGKICCNALVCIAAAHCCGRIGCYLNGCCYGLPTGSIFDVLFPQMVEKVFPTQLFEAAFLLVLFLILLKSKQRAIYLYPLCYGIFRFFIEFLRGDSRGKFLFSYLSPSQTQSLLLIMIGIFVLVYAISKNKISSSKPDA